MDSPTLVRLLTRQPIPEELRALFAGDRRLGAAFELLTARQRSSYAQWVTNSPLPRVRKTRAELVCSVVRAYAA